MFFVLKPGIPHKSEGNTEHDGCDGSCVFHPCAECSAVYVGETVRTLKVRMTEHRRAVKNMDPKNGIAMHVQKTAHAIDWQEARMREENWGRRRVLEALEIQQRRLMMTWMLV